VYKPCVITLAGITLEPMGRRKNKSVATGQSAAVQKALREEKEVRKEVRKAGSQLKKLQQGHTMGFAPPRKRSVQGVMKNELSISQKIAQSLCIPMENIPYRYSSMYSSKPTAVAGPWFRTNTEFATSSADTGSTPYPNAQHMVGFVFRNPCRYAVLLDQNPNGDVYSYQMLFKVNAPLAPTFPSATYDYNPGGGTNDEIVYLPTVVAQALDAYQPHGAHMLPGIDEMTAGRYFWIDALSGQPATISLTFAAALTGSAYMFLDRWDAGTVQQGAFTATGSSTATSMSVTVDIPGYYCIRFSATQLLTITQCLYENDGTPSYAHLALPMLFQNAASATSMRISAASIMFTNKASELYKEGKIVAAQLPEGISWTKYVCGESPYDNVASVNGSVALEAKNGIYGYMKPTKPSDFDLQSYLQFAASGVFGDSTWPLKERTSYLCVCMELITPQSRSGYWTLAAGVEYETNDVWRQKGNAMVSPDAYSEALLFLKSATQFTENPMHFGKIWGSIKKTASKVGRAVEKYGPSVLKGAAALAALA